MKYECVLTAEYIEGEWRFGVSGSDEPIRALMAAIEHQQFPWIRAAPSYVEPLRISMYTYPDDGESLLRFTTHGDWRRELPEYGPFEKFEQSELAKE